MYRYAQINKNGYVVSNSCLSGEVTAENMIPIPEEFDITDKKYVNGQWTEYTPEPAVEEPSEQAIMQAEVLLSQQEIIIKQKEHDEVLAEILLSQQTV
ncbi:flagellar basal-body rod protein [Lachnospiraceae bacterium NSJ-143]|nr:flagellar basal-body rod protein [Lachnospiraceae bacterium NSJ-143]